MKSNPRLIGDTHVKEVSIALKQSILKKYTDSYSQTTRETVKFINACYPNIKKVFSKFDTGKIEKDLILILDDDSKIEVNLFLIKKGAKIQPKNLGAKSFLKKYFLEEEIQTFFNEKLEVAYRNFLKRLYEEKEDSPYFGSLTELKQVIHEKFPKFTLEINPARDEFLYTLREECFTLLTNLYNGKNQGLLNAYNTFLMVGDLNIITSYGKGGEVSVEEFKASTPKFADIKIYKLGKSALGIRCGEIGFTMRFKFESKPSSSIKLATSYEYFVEEKNSISKNESTIKAIKELFQNHSYIKTKNFSNAIGKCHEALTYYYFLKEYPDIIQVEKEKCIKLLNQFSQFIDPEILKVLHDSTATIVPEIKRKLKGKYGIYYIESIELIPESYIQDRLSTADIKLILRVQGNYVIEEISLKAIARRSSKITTKNPGVGSILGPIYFNIGNMSTVVSETKVKYENGILDRMGALENLSEELGVKLQMASPEQLNQGIKNLMGTSMMAITFYKEKQSYCKEPSEIKGDITVHVKSPTPIQNTLSWNNGKEMLNLRMKFSRGQEYGWSSVKLTSEYQLKY